MQMRVLHCESSMNWGGQEMRVLEEHQALRSRGHLSWLVCSPHSALYRAAFDAGVPKSEILALELRRSWRLDRAYGLLALCRKLGVQIITTRGSRETCLAQFARSTGCSVVRHFHIARPPRGSMLLRYGSDCNVAAAKVIENYLHSAAVPAPKTVLLGEGVSLNHYFPAEASEALQLELESSPKVFTLLNVGMLRRDKGQLILLRALNALRRAGVPCRLLMVGGSVGDHGYELELQRYIANNELNEDVQMLGYREDIYDLMRLADLLVVPSLIEAQSRVVPQAFASQCPVLATNIGGLPELVLHGITGRLCRPDDVGALADGILDAIQNTQRTSTMCQTAFDYASETLVAEHKMTELFSIYAKVLRGSAEQRRPLPRDAATISD